VKTSTLRTEIPSAYSRARVSTNQRIRRSGGLDAEKCLRVLQHQQPAAAENAAEDKLALLDDTILA
jgi:hypothetical protein